MFIYPEAYAILGGLGTAGSTALLLSASMSSDRQPGGLPRARRISQPRFSQQGMHVVIFSPKISLLNDTGYFNRTYAQIGEYRLKCK